MPSIEAMLMTLAGFSAVAAARNGAASALVRKNGVLTLRFITDHPADAARPPGHQRDASLQRKQILEHVVSLAFADGSGRRRHGSQGTPFSSSGQVTHAASMRRKPFHIAVAAPEVSTGK